MSYIDSGPTQSFFNDRNLFEELQELPKQTVNFSEGMCKNVVKLWVTLSLGTIISMETHYALDSSSNTIACHIASDHFEVHMTSTLHREKACLLFKKRYFSLNNIVLETKCSNGLYPVHESNISKTSLTAVTQNRESEY